MSYFIVKFLLLLTEFCSSNNSDMVDNLFRARPVNRSSLPPVTEPPMLQGATDGAPLPVVGIVLRREDETWQHPVHGRVEQTAPGAGRWKVAPGLRTLSPVTPRNPTGPRVSAALFQRCAEYSLVLPCLWHLQFDRSRVLYDCYFCGLPILLYNWFWGKSASSLITLFISVCLLFSV